MTKKATISDIAKRAGVARGTVSRVLNDHPNVSPKARLKVMTAIADLQYRPSSVARHLRTQQSKLIGFITDEVATTPYAGDIIRGAEETLFDSERILLVVSTGRDRHRVETAIDTLLDRDVEGILYAAMYHQPVELPRAIYEVPAVLVNCFAADHSLPSVVPDEVCGGREATEILIERGHERIAFINIYTLNPGIPASIGRFEGYQQALREHGLPFDPALVKNGDGTSLQGYQLTLELMTRANPPSAIFCGNDRTAMGSYNALHKLGLSIPEDVAIVGFDNQDLIAGSLLPTLTSMQLPHYEMGQWAANYILNQIQLLENEADDDGVANHNSQVEPHLMHCPAIIRESC